MGPQLPIDDAGPFHSRLTKKIVAEIASAAEVRED
jgi:hypothetical protein